MMFKAPGAMLRDVMRVDASRNTRVVYSHVFYDVYAVRVTSRDAL